MGRRMPASTGVRQSRLNCRAEVSLTSRYAGRDSWAEATETASSKQAASQATRARKQVTAAPHRMEPELVSLEEEPALERLPCRKDQAIARCTWHAFPCRPFARLAASARPAK